MTRRRWTVSVRYPGTIHAYVVGALSRREARRLASARRAAGAVSSQRVHSGPPVAGEADLTTKRACAKTKYKRERSLLTPWALCALI